MNFEKAWNALTRVTAFIVGLGILVYETVFEHTDRPWLLAAALGLLGLPVARAAEQLLGKQQPPPSPPSPPAPPDPPVKS